MNTIVTQQEIGKRIAALRKRKGLSQEDLAKLLDISRPSLTQIELGNRKLEAFEFRQLSLVLGFSMDALMTPDFSVYDFSDPDHLEKETVLEERISVPVLHGNKFKNVILYILEKCAGKPNVGETVLNKLLYFSDFNYYEVYEEHLTGAVYRKLPYGPVPQNMDSVIDQMVRKGELKRVKTNYYNLPQTRYIPLIKSDLTQLRASEKEIIDRVIDQMSDWSGTAISNYSHKDMPWVASKEGEEIDYELVFYRDHPYSVRNYKEEDE
ncbi:MAG: type II toxin-antitoxin system antitoxin SocA domain-containing protein [Bacteroidales bacterium]|jgi:transcriptional regulator with XRE-family HTH domain